MKKRIISALLVICLLLGGTANIVFAAEAETKREYYQLEVLHTDYKGNSSTVAVDFMVLTPAKESTGRVYIKAEDFSRVTGGDYSYEYNQTYTECAFVSAATKHVVRYMLNSPNVSVVYVGDSVSYTAPYDILFEGDVTWLPFEFSVQLFHLQAIPQEETIHIISSRYNPISVANLAHQEVRDLAFDWIDEVGESYGDYAVGVISATTVSCINKLLKFEPSAWGAMLASLLGEDYFVDAGYAETIAKSFISPSQQEIKEADKQFLKILSGIPGAYDNMMGIEISTGGIRKNINNADDFVKGFVNKIPALGKSKAVTNLQKALSENKNGFKKVANEVLADMEKHLDAYGDTSAKEIEFFLTFVEVMENYMVFLNKNDRAVAALKMYEIESKYDEKNVLGRYAITDNEFLHAVKETTIDGSIQFVDGAITSSLGHFGAALELSGFVWDLASGVGPLKTGISATDNRVISEYAIQYQDDSLGIYYDYRNKCLASGGANETSLDKMLSSLYAYLKFSYIARNAAEASFTNVSELTWGEGKVNAQNSAKVLRNKNQRLAEYLIYMEMDVFTPSDAKNFQWNDTVYADVLKEKGTPIERPTQDTEPVFEFSDFPGFESNEYISEEEAIELVKRVLGKFSGGLMSEYLVELYTYEVIGGYADQEVQAYIVQLYIDGHADTMFFVSVIGTEVWLGSGNPDDGYYVYTDLDLLHADFSDMIGAIGDLGGQLIGEAMKE